MSDGDAFGSRQCRLLAWSSSEQAKVPEIRRLGPCKGLKFTRSVVPSATDMDTKVDRCSVKPETEHVHHFDRLVAENLKPICQHATKRDCCEDTDSAPPHRACLLELVDATRASASSFFISQIQPLLTRGHPPNKIAP